MFFKLMYLFKIGLQIKKVWNMFIWVMKVMGYCGKYYYCYCIKSSYFSYVFNEVLWYGVEIEMFLVFDIDFICCLYKRGRLQKEIIIVCNGFKIWGYLECIVVFINDGFENVILVCDNMVELDFYEQYVKGVCKIGLCVVIEEEFNFEFYIFCFGIWYVDVLCFFEECVKNNDKFQFKMFYFFVDMGIKDFFYYWGELKKVIKLYCELKCNSQDFKVINIGGGMFICNFLGFEFDYKYMVKEIVGFILQACEEEEILELDIFIEFGKYMVGESGVIIFFVFG